MNLGPIIFDIGSYIKGQGKMLCVQKNSNLHMNYCPPVFVAVGAEGKEIGNYVNQKLFSNRNSS